MRYRVTGLLLGVLLLSACGGGGGSESANSSSSRGTSTGEAVQSGTSTSVQQSDSLPSDSLSGESAQDDAQNDTSALETLATGATVATVATAASADQVSATFSPTNAELPNPERGFYRWAWTNLDRLTAEDMQDAYVSGYRLVYAPLRLDAYRNSALPDALLSKLRASFAVARRAGVKILVRAVYNYPDNETEYENAQDASLQRVLAHIAQLKPVVQENADVIAFVQAGFIGAWGEWHTSSNNLTSVTNRTRIRDALLDAVPGGRFIQVRYPPYLMAWTPTLPSLSAALQGSYRVGAHNDCFLASPTDVGTYSEDATTRAGQRNYVAALGQLAPFGGETCDPADDPDPRPRTTCTDILTEGSKYHLSYLNDEYYRDIFHERWTANGCMAEIKRKMGYRLQLQSVGHPAVASRGQSMRVNLVVRNVGWARLYNPRRLEVILRHQATGKVTRINTSGADPRSWLPARDSTAALNVAIPATLNTGNYDVLLAFPDATPSLRGDVRYAIRPANADVSARSQRWEAGLGAFRTGSQLQVR